jgi:hypothetical protein
LRVLFAGALIAPETCRQAASETTVITTMIVSVLRLCGGFDIELILRGLERVERAVVAPHMGGRSLARFAMRLSKASTSGGLVSRIIWPPP